jgi:hypothetical protein
MDSLPAPVKSRERLDARLITMPLFASAVPGPANSLYGSGDDRVRDMHKSNFVQETLDGAAESATQAHIASE